MRELCTLEVDKWVPGERKGTIKHAGMISPQEAFDSLEKHLKEAGLMPDEYFQSNAYAWDDVKELPNYIRASCDVNWGGSEGIYLDISLLYRDENREIQRFYFATGKTLGETGDDFLRMSRIAAECSMMLNGRGEMVRFYEEEKGFILPKMQNGSEISERAGDAVVSSLDSQIQNAVAAADQYGNQTLTDKGVLGITRED